MSTITRDDRLGIYNAISSTDFFENLCSQGMLISFLNSIWELRALPSTDSRFVDLMGDIQQHMINNNDWTFEILFLDKLSLLESSDSIFQAFLERSVDNKYHIEGDSPPSLVSTINEYLIPKGFELTIYNYDENGIEEYQLTIISSEKTSIDFPQNTTPFYVEKKPSGYSHKVSSHTRPETYPSFVLVADGWDDFHVKSTFDLFYYNDKDSNPTHIGSVKIIHTTELRYSEVEENGYYTKNYLPDQFISLPNTFCSLGQTTNYYSVIKKLFNLRYKSILWALKDCAIFSEIEDEFNRHKQFSSLIRENEAEQVLRQEKYIIEGQDIKLRYQFKYSYTPKYSINPIDIEFKFEKEGLFPNRLYAIIGENGVGKTQFITSLPLDIANKNSEVFYPHIPIFSKIIAVSNSYYDNFKIPKSNASFNYIYCGLSKITSKGKETLTPLALKLRLQKACKDIQKKERTASLKRILDNILETDLISEMFTEVDTDDGESQISFSYQNLSDICNKTSSGQSTLIYLLCNIVSNIRYDSLLLFDEPETHLHPNAITTLVSAIYELLEEYQSYGIISTHSPLIIREMLSKSVYIMEREGNHPSIRKIGLESFGENLTILTEEIFGNKTVEKYYKNRIIELINEDYSYDQIIDLLESDQIPLSLNTTMYIRNLISSINENN